MGNAVKYPGFFNALSAIARLLPFPMRIRSFLLLASFALFATACSDADAPGTTAPDTLATPLPAETPAAVDGDLTTREAVAVLNPTEGNDVRGQVTFTATGGGVRVVAEIEGLGAGTHGFHVHEFGDCSAPDASSAGGHFNPQNAPHGAPDAPAAERHAGDLGNIEADADGTARYDRTDAVLSLSGPNSVIGKAVVVHAQRDDLTSQPTGDAGDRLACGVIEAADGMDGNEGVMNEGMEANG